MKRLDATASSGFPYLFVKRFGRLVFVWLPDSLLLIGALWLSVALRWDSLLDADPTSMRFPLRTAVLLVPLLYGILYLALGMHRVIWQYANLRDMSRICLAVSACVLLLCGTQILLDWLAFPAGQQAYFLPWGVYPICICIGALLLCARYMLQRSVSAWRHRRRALSGQPGSGRILIIGAGMAANQLIRNFDEVATKQQGKIVCALDDNPDRQGAKLSGVPVVGKIENLSDVTQKYSIDTIIFAIPSCPRARKAEILSMCTDTGCRVRTVPAVEELIGCRLRPEDIRNVNIEDLLEREPITIDTESISGYLTDQTVLVTGAGGSIGSELCKQIASHAPRKLIMLDIAENSMYELQNELRAAYPELELYALVGSVRDSARLERVFSAYQPQVVYHAAAHKHVPLMEDSPAEAVKNNVFGTLNTVQAAHRAGTRRFVLISTDKAVNPTNVMGACKRVCEMIVQYYNGISQTHFTAVRFGNVLGSNGSVVPLFKRQIEMGGPVTVTHPDIVRYFMTIPEAVSLVLQAGSLADQEGILILDMGKPVRIRDMAYRLIRLSGYVPDRDIKVVYTGLRPGEKIFEELVDHREALLATSNSLIRVDKQINLPADFLGRLQALGAVLQDEDADVRALLQQLVPTYRIRSDADRAAGMQYNDPSDSIEDHE